MLSSTPRKLAYMVEEEDMTPEQIARRGFPARLAQAFRTAKRLNAKGDPDRAWLAGELGISVQAVGQALNPNQSIVFSAYTNARAAAALGCDPGWLATGSMDEPSRALIHGSSNRFHEVDVSALYAKLDPAGKEVFHRLLDVAGLLEVQRQGNQWSKEEIIPIQDLNTPATGRLGAVRTPSQREEE